MSSRVKLLREGESVQVSGTVGKNRNEILSEEVQELDASEAKSCPRKV